MAPSPPKRPDVRRPKAWQKSLQLVDAQLDAAGSAALLVRHGMEDWGFLQKNLGEVFCD